MQYRVKDRLRPEDFKMTVEGIRGELDESIKYEEHRDNVDQAKKRAVKQMMDYEGFRQMVLGADLKPVKTNEMRDLIGVNNIGGGPNNPISNAKNDMMHESVKLVVDSVNEDQDKSLQKLTKPESYEARNFREFKKIFDKLLTKNPKEENESELVDWLKTIPMENLPQIVSVDFDVSYLVVIFGVMAKWINTDKYEEKRFQFAWFLDFLLALTKLKGFSISIKPMLKSSERMELRKTLDSVKERNTITDDIVDEIKLKYLK